MDTFEPVLNSSVVVRFFLETNVFRLHINISAGRDNYIINAQHTWSFSRNREFPFRCIGCGLYQFPHKVKNVFYQTFFQSIMYMVPLIRPKYTL